MPKFSSKYEKMEYVLRAGRKTPIWGMPRILSLVIIVIFLLIDVIAVLLGITAGLAAFFGYLSALILLLELTYESGMKISVKWMKGLDKPETEEEKINKYRERYEFWFATYIWFINPVKCYLSRFTGIDPFGWGKDEELISGYKLRFNAFILLILAINFDICSRLF